mgnify:CR=1 FL=1
MLAASVLMVLPLAGCTQANPSPPPSPQVTVACSGPTNITSTSFTYTRLEAAAGSQWWVTIGVLRNDCKSTIKLSQVFLQDQGSGFVTWTGRTGLYKGSDTSLALWPRAAAPAFSSLEGAKLDPGSTVQLVALVTQPDKGLNNVSKFSLSYFANSSFGTLPLPSTIRICGCKTVS